MAVFGVGTELAAFERMERRIGMTAEPYSQGRGGSYVRAGKILSGVGLAGALLGRRSRVLSAATRWESSTPACSQRPTRSTRSFRSANGGGQQLLLPVPRQADRRRVRPANQLANLGGVVRNLVIMLPSRRALHKQVAEAVRS
jgi:hypothetical protein